MRTLDSIIRLLDENGADYQVIRHDKAICSTKDAVEYFDIAKAAPVFVLDTDVGLVSFIKSAERGKIPFAELKRLLNCTRVGLADSATVRRQSGCDIGSVPLVGLPLPAVFDNLLLRFEYIYGGTGDIYHTLKIAPADAQRLNRVIASLE